jgi:hypothetical protein
MCFYLALRHYPYQILHLKFQSYKLHMKILRKVNAKTSAIRNVKDDK